MINYYYAFWTKFYENLYKRRNGNIVYMFHSISDEKTNPRNFVSNKDSFEQFLLKELSAKKVAPLSEIVKRKCSGKFAITFDDVFDNVYLNAYPLLKKYNIPFTLFVTVGLLNKQGYITEEELKIMAADSLCTVGAHTISHAKLRGNKNSFNEIKDSKTELESILDEKVLYFAYPYGSTYACSNKNKKEAKLAGYEAAFSTIRGFISPSYKTEKFFLPRNNGDHYVKMIEEGKEIEASNSSCRI